MTVALHVDQTRAEGLLGASDAACAFGLDKYKSPLTMWKQLRGIETDDERPDFVREAAEWGQALEPVVRGKYALVTGSVVYVPSESTIKDGWLRCTPDGFVALAAHAIDAHGTTVELHGQDLHNSISGLYQGKTCSAYKRDEWETGVPQNYEIQERVEMAVCDLPWADVCCLVGGQRFVGPIRITRDAALEDRILTDLSKFWELVKRGIEPTVDGTDAWREHISERMNQLNSKVEIDADAELRELVNAARGLRAERKRVTDGEASIRNAILLRMSAAGATVIRMGDERVSAYKTGGRTDWKGAYASASKEPVPERFKKPSTTWALRLGGDDD